MKIVLVIWIFSLVTGCISTDQSNSENVVEAKVVSIMPRKDTSGINDSSGKDLSDTIIALTVSYAAIECGCPQWFETKFTKVKFLEGAERFYLEPINKNLINANSLWDGEHVPLTLKVTGRLSRGKEIPGTYRTKGEYEKARIFWYNSLTVVSPSSK